MTKIEQAAKIITDATKANKNDALRLAAIVAETAEEMKRARRA